MVKKSENLKQKAINFYENLPLAQKNYSYVSRFFKIHRSTLKNWVESRLKTGQIIENSKPTKNKKKQDKIKKILNDILKKENIYNASQIQHELAKEGLKLSTQTIRSYLLTMGGKYKNLKGVPPLPLAHRKKRIEFASNYKELDWNFVIYADESTFSLMDYPRKAWALPNQKKEVIKIKHPKKINAWGCFSAKGFGKLVLFTETMDSKKLISIYKNALLPSAKMWFGRNRASWYLLEDNDPKHKSKVSKEWKEKNRINCLPFPPCSPDLNPIENVWGTLKKVLKKKPASTLKDLEKNIKYEWKALTKEYAEKMSSVLQERLQLIIDNQGEFLK